MVELSIAPDRGFFESLPAVLRQKVRLAARLRTFAAGAFLHQGGDPSDSLSIIETGSVRMSRLGRDGDRIIIADLSAGETFGLMPLLSRQPRSHDAQALTQLRLLQINRAAIGRLMSESPDLRDHIIAQLAARLLKALETVEDERRFPLKVRLAKLLLQKSKGTKSVRGTQAALAEELGVSRYGVGLALADMSANGLIVTAYGELFIKDRQRLNDLMG